MEKFSCKLKLFSRNGVEIDWFTDSTTGANYSVKKSATVLTNEIDCLRKVQGHSAFVQMLEIEGAFQGSIVTNLAYRSLERLIQTGGPILERRAILITRKILEGLRFLHAELKLSHGQLNSSNILISLEGTAQISELSLCQPISKSLETADISNVGRIVFEMLTGKALTWLRKLFYAPKLSKLAAEFVKQTTKGESTATTLLNHAWLLEETSLRTELFGHKNFKEFFTLWKPRKGRKVIWFRDLTTGRNFAAKVFLSSTRDYLNESKLVEHIGQHETIVPKLKIIHESSIQFIAMDLAYCSLADWLKARGCVPENEAAKPIFQAMCGLDYLHRVVGVCHRDIKPENLLIMFNGKVVISDFGSAARFGSIDDLRGICGCRGTRGYRAPETVQFPFCYNWSVDIWSLGVTTLKLLTGKRVCKQSCRPCRFDQHFEGDVGKFLARCMTPNPADREKAGRLVHDDWFINNGLAI